SAPARFYCVDHEPLAELKLAIPGRDSIPRREHVLRVDARISGRVPSWDLEPWPAFLRDPERPDLGRAVELADLWEDWRGGKDCAGALTGVHLEFLERRTGMKAAFQSVTELPRDRDYLSF